MQTVDTFGYKGPGITAMYRMYRIDYLVRNGHYPNVPKLAKSLEVSKRTVERDLERMKDLLGAPVCFCWKRKGYYYTDNSFSLPPVNLSEEETVALFLGQKLLAQYRGTPYEKTVKAAFGKILMLLPDYISSDLEGAERAVSFAVEHLRGDEDAVLQRYNLLLNAIRDCRVISADYYSASRDERMKREINPYHLRFHEGAWYMIGYCHYRNDIRMFAVDRIESLQVTDLKFAPDPGFSIDRYLGDSMKIERGVEPKEIIIRFDAKQARYIRERLWHHSQKTEELADGSLILRLQVSGLGEVKRLVLGFGSAAEVLAPPELRAEIERETKKMADKYR